MALLGVDIGSSRCKAVAFAADGRVLAEAVREYHPSFPGPARVELDPEVLRRAVYEAIAAAASATSEPMEALGLSSHGESFLAVDGPGRPLGPAIMNADHRATEEARRWEQELGREHLFQVTGHVMHPMYPLAKWRWLRRHQPELFASAARFVGPSEYVLLSLGLPPFVAHSLASRTMAFDVRRRAWAEELLSAAGLTPAQLPLPVPSGTRAGSLSRTAAAALGLPEGLPVVVAGHDQPCGAVGMGAIAPGMVTDSIGSYECLVAVVEQPTLGAPALAAGLNSYCHARGDQYLTIAYFPSGLMVNWFCRTFCEAEQEAAAREGGSVYARLEAQCTPGPTGLCITPHLIGSANPHFEARATGAVVGLRQTTRRADVYQGILEGLACELALVAELLSASVGEFEVLRCTGGGARSRLGLQLRAALTGRTMQTMESAEAVCLGAALLAGVEAGAYRDLNQAVGAAVRTGEAVAPDEALRSAYAAQFAQYRALYPALAPLRDLEGA